MAAEDSSDSSQLLTPRTPRRRRSSVMFSDIVVEHGSGDGGDHVVNVNVCWNEKMTQTGDYGETGASTSADGHLLAGSNPSSPSSLNRKSSLKQRTTSRPADERLASYSAPGPGPGSLAPIPPVSGAGLTCQELLALSGALGAALPTPLALPSYPSGSEEATAAVAAKHSNNNNQLAPPGALMPILPTLAMSLWPEPFNFQGTNSTSFNNFLLLLLSEGREIVTGMKRRKLLLSIFSRVS